MKADLIGQVGEFLAEMLGGLGHAPVSAPATPPGGAYREAQHPRVARGRPGAGQWTRKAALHYGPGPHPDGSPQAVHGGNDTAVIARSAVTASRQKPKFTPSANLADAERYAQRFARSADYFGLTLAEANTVNRVAMEMLAAARTRIREVYTVPEWDNGIAGEGAIGLGIPQMRAPVRVSEAEHSMAFFSDQAEALVRHELGHLIADRHEDRLHNLLPYRSDWEKAYGVTARARDHWNECLAENIALYSAGREDLLHPGMLRALKTVMPYQEAQP